ncbi:hypothetical protein BGX29_008598 [Mortierella sp. GBA35]|nr:hypothetical protein BGX23_007518 [Mortierella sp. AD031]KAF9106740.1 hypothetical protein BGX29_008598 [Mortierella sp. GBA35]KAG0216185.1 hypothetical protein BGX33_000372 [Mortierella sp. NVP41]
MRLKTVTLTLSLAFAFLASAAPAPIPQIPEETPEQKICLDSCLTTEENCLLSSNSMSLCVEAFDTCHQICFPEQHLPTTPETPAPGTGTPAPAPGGAQKHKDVTQETTDSDDEDEDVEDDGTAGTGPGPVKGLVLTPEEINRQQESYHDDPDDVDLIPAPKGGEDDDEFNDDPSDY